MKTNRIYIVYIGLTVLVTFNSEWCLAQTPSADNPCASEGAVIDPDVTVGPIYITQLAPSANNSCSSANLQGVIVCDGDDILLDDPNFLKSQSEEHISIDKHSPNNILIGCNLYDAGINADKFFGYYVSHDGNQTWTAHHWSQHNEGEAGSTDPATSFDASGNAYYSILGDDAIYTQRSPFPNNGSVGSWSTPQATCASANFTAYYYMDKEMMESDNIPGNTYQDYLYTAWTRFHCDANPNDGCSGEIVFNRSTNAFPTFDNTNQVILRDENWLPGGIGQGANVQTGPDGQVYVCWAEGAPASSISISVSMDGGYTFFAPDFPNPGPGDLLFENAFNVNGMRYDPTTPSPLFNQTRVNDFPSMAVDKTCGGNGHRGRIYITYDQWLPFYYTNDHNKSRICCQYSDDQGLTWHPCNNINSDNSFGIVDYAPFNETYADNQNQYWMPWIAVDDATGIVCIAYLAIEDASFNTNVYMAYSSDGGAHFDNWKVSDASHYTETIAGYFTTGCHSGYCGDYIGVAAYGGKAYITWHDNRNNTDLWQAYCSTETFNVPVNYSAYNSMDVYGSVIISDPAQPALYEGFSVNVTSNSSTFDVLSGASATFRARNSVKMNPGFSARNGSTFHAYIDNFFACATPWRPEGIPSDAFSSTNEKENSIITYPVPFENSLTLEYQIYQDQSISIRLFDVFGKEVSLIKNNEMTKAGKYTLNTKTNNLIQGTYFCKLQTQSETITHKVVKIN